MTYSKIIIHHIIDENIIEAKKIVTSLIFQKAKVHLDDQKRNIAAEMFGGCKTCNEPTLEEGSAEEYKVFFKSALKKFGVSSPSELESDAERKKFFDYVDKNWKGEQAENVEEATDAHNRMLATYASSSDKKVFDALKRDGYIVNFENSDTLVRNILKKTGGDVKKAVEEIKKMKLMNKKKAVNESTLTDDQEEWMIGIEDVRGVVSEINKVFDKGFSARQVQQELHRVLLKFKLVGNDGVIVKHSSMKSVNWEAISDSEDGAALVRLEWKKYYGRK